MESLYILDQNIKTIENYINTIDANKSLYDNKKRKFYIG